MSTMARLLPAATVAIAINGLSPTSIRCAAIRDCRRRRQPSSSVMTRAACERFVVGRCHHSVAGSASAAGPLLSFERRQAHKAGQILPSQAEPNRYPCRDQEPTSGKLAAMSDGGDGAQLPNGIAAKELATKQHQNHGDQLKTTPPPPSNEPCDDQIERDYRAAIRDLNFLQSNNQVLALAKYKRPEMILPLFSRQLELAGIGLAELDKLNVIHVSGTKGKGSTCAFLESILIATSPRLKVGCYNSPHLVQVTERIKINGTPIERSLFSKYFRRVFDRLTKETEREQVAMPSYFAFLTILAFHVFIEEEVDCAIIEVGIGGEYDPTNIIGKPVACAITTLDLDHTNILGNTIKSIAWTKAGIIKPSVPMFTVEHEHDEAIEMIQTRARQKGSPVYVCKPLATNDPSQLGIQGPAQVINASVACQLAAYALRRLRPAAHSDEPTPLPPPSSVPSGDHQVIELATGFDSLPASFKEGLRRSQLAGRCQIVETAEAVFFLDGAHTRKSMENCLDWFMRASSKLANTQDSLPPSRILMVNIIGERNKCEVLKPLLPQRKQFDRIIFTSNKIRPIVTFDNSMDSETFVRQRDTNYEKGVENVKNNAKVWLKLVEEYDPTDKGCLDQFIIMPTIIESIQSVLPESNINGSTAATNIQPIDSSKKPHILATGSLHFVGALLETIEELKSSSRENNKH
jgi:folylpolyglutamate synthase